MTINGNKWLIWAPGAHYLLDQHGQILLDKKPELSFQYQELKYWTSEQYYVNVDGLRLALTQAQVSEIEEWVSNMRLRTGILKLCVDSEGKFLGYINRSDSRVATEIDRAPPNGDDWRWDHNGKTWIRAYHYDRDGKYVLESSGNGVGWTAKPYPTAVAPVSYVFDTVTENWIVDKKQQDLYPLIKNKLLFDSVVEYLRVTLSSLGDSSKELEYLRNVLTSISSLPVHNQAVFDDWQSFITKVEGTNSVLEAYEKFTDFNTKINTSLYNAPAAQIEKLAIDDFVNNLD